jgi:hypothetical protein
VSTATTAIKNTNAANHFPALDRRPLLRANGLTPEATGVSLFRIACRGTGALEEFEWLRAMGQWGDVSRPD